MSAEIADTGDLKRKEIVPDIDELEKTDLLSELVSQVQPIEKISELIRSFPVVCFGEASHGTKEFYYYRCKLTKEQIQDGSLQALLIEGDLPDCAELHRYVMGQTKISLDEVLDNCLRFPQWMWENKAMKEFIIWLREHNSKQVSEKRCGIFGLDLYSLHTSMTKIIEYLNEHDSETANTVKQQYSGFQQFGSDSQLYGLLVQLGVKKGCQNAVIAALKLIAEKTPFYAHPIDGISAMDNSFINEMHARVVLNAEEYYRSMFNSNISSWDFRNTHFFDILTRTRQHLLQTRGSDRVIVWAHNHHVGDARFTHLDLPLSAARELNVGQLIKEKYGDQAVAIGQLTHHGAYWGEDNEVKVITDAVPGSYEEIFHVVSAKSKRPVYFLDMRAPKVSSALASCGNRLQRSIGVIRRAPTERLNIYYCCDITQQFDIIIWNDLTHPVIPMEANDTGLVNLTKTLTMNVKIV